MSRKQLSAQISRAVSKEDDVSVISGSLSGLIGNSNVVRFPVGLTTVGASGVTQMDMPVPFSGKIKNLFITTEDNAPGGGQNCKVTVQVNDSDSLLTATVSAIAQAANNITTSVNVVAGDGLRISVENSSGAANETAQWSFELGK